MSGAFVAFEGIDGSGTSTQARLLHERLIAKGRRSVLTSEPTAGPLGNLIRQIMIGRLKFSEDVDALDKFLAYLFAADRFDHLHNEVDGILRLVRSGVDVISTRYYFSSLAYHVTSEEDWSLVRGLNAKFRDPDLTIYLDCPVDMALARLAESRQITEHYENARKLKAVSSNYKRVFGSYLGRWIQVDATLDRAHQQQIIAAEVDKLLSEQIADG